MRSALIVLALAGAVVPASTALASAMPQTIAAGGSFGIQLLPTPAGPGSDPLARTYIVARIAPGKSISRRVEITNNTRSKANVTVYKAGAGFSGGRFGFASGHTANELSGWISVSRGRLQVAPGGTTVETVTVRVPKRAAPGERYAVVWAQMSAPSAAARSVRLVNRVGVRMYLSVGLGDMPPVSFTVGSLRAERSRSGQPLVVATVHSSSRRPLAISGNLTLTNGPEGLGAGPVAIVATIAPAATQKLSVLLDKGLPLGPWHAEITLSSGAVHRTIEATIRFPRGPIAVTQPAAQAVPSESHDQLFLVLGLGALAAAAASALFLARRPPPGMLRP